MNNKANKIDKKERKRIEREQYENNVINYNRVVAIELANRRKEKVAPKDSYISIQNVNKIYDNLVQAVYDFNLDIKKNEFVVFVGPSGCGKSTTLRMIAGLEEITAGNLFIDGAYANALPPKNRNIAMVFQSYALYPHMSVYDNLAFSMKIRPVEVPLLDENGNKIYDIDEKKLAELNYSLEKQNKKLSKFNAKLEKVNGLISKVGSDVNNKIVQKLLIDKTFYEHEIKYINSEIEKLNIDIEKTKNENIVKTEFRKLSKSEIDEVVQEASKILQIEEFLNRKPKQLSGGQRQRVALGRAICKRAKLFLMDEPLSNLDAKLRVSMRSEIIRIHKAVGATTIYVTHDQTEAMTMADRIVIMNAGYIQQIGSPKEIYNHPANIFVATFIGSPAMNIYDVNVENKQIKFDENHIINVPESLIQKINESIKEKLANIDNFIENGLEEERKKELEVKKETMRLRLGHSKKRYAFDKESGTAQDLLKLVSLDEYDEEICKNMYERKLEEVKKSKEFYEKAHQTQVFSLNFGVRPEHVYIKKAGIENEIQCSDTLKVKVSIPELLGNEYFLHTEIGSKDFVFKAIANSDFTENEELEIVFDLNKIHFFDKIDSKLIA